MTILNVSDPQTAKKINDIINSSNHAFVLIYMVGCGPCNATRPEWKKMCHLLENNYSTNDDVVILDIDSKFMNEISGIEKIDGFPTIKYINKKNNVVEDFENSNIPEKTRSSKSFIEWVNSKVSNKVSNENKNKKTVHDLSRFLSQTQRHSAKPSRKSRNVKKSRNLKKSRNVRKSRKNKNKRTPKRF